MSTHNIPFQYKKENHPKSAAMEFFIKRAPERVQNSRSKRAISVRATEGLLYFHLLLIQLYSHHFKGPKKQFHMS